MKSGAVLAAGFLVFGAASSAHAVLLTYDFTGVLESVQMSRPGAGANQGFNLEQGAVARGHITFDLKGFSEPRNDRRGRTVHYAVKDFAMTVGPLDIDVRGIGQGLRPLELSNNKGGQDIFRYGEYHATADYAHPSQSGPLDVLLFEFVGGPNALPNETLQHLRRLDRFDARRFVLANEGGLDMRNPDKALFTASGRIDSFTRRSPVDVVPNPEPASFALGALGLGAAALARRRKRSKPVEK